MHTLPLGRLLQAYIITFQMPIFIANVSEDETWGIPYNVTDCPPGLCYNRTTRTKWCVRAIEGSRSP